MAVDKIEFISNVYQNIQSMITLADSKANTILTIQSLLLSITIGTSIVTDIFQKIKAISTDFALIYFILLVCFIICSILGIIFSIMVFKARGCTDELEAKRNGLIYFGHVTNFKNSSEYLSSINQLDETKIIEEYSSQIYQISCIAKEKMINVNKSINILLVNVFFAILILIAAGYFTVH